MLKISHIMFSVFQVYCGLPAQWNKHAHVRCLCLFQVSGGFLGYFQRLLCDGCSHRSRHCSHILLWCMLWNEITNVTSNFQTDLLLRTEPVLQYSSLTRSPRHQVHQTALLSAAGDGPLLPHVLEHLLAGRGLRVHRWAVSGHSWGGSACRLGSRH